MYQKQYICLLHKITRRRYVKLTASANYTVWWEPKSASDPSRAEFLNVWSCTVTDNYVHTSRGWVPGGEIRDSGTGKIIQGVLTSSFKGKIIKFHLDLSRFEINFFKKEEKLANKISSRLPLINSFVLKPLLVCCLSDTPMMNTFSYRNTSVNNNMLM